MVTHKRTASMKLSLKGQQREVADVFDWPMEFQMACQQTPPPWNAEGQTFGIMAQSNFQIACERHAITRDLESLKRLFDAWEQGDENMHDFFVAEEKRLRAL